MVSELSREILAGGAGGLESCWAVSGMGRGPRLAGAPRLGSEPTLGPFPKKQPEPGGPPSPTWLQRLSINSRVFEGTAFPVSSPQAVLGVQLVVTLLTATLMHRLAPHCSFARWLLCNGRYKHPSEDELRALAGKKKPRGRKERWANGGGEEKPLSVPRDTPFQLETCPLTAVDALVLRFFLEYQWFVDFAVYSGGVYLFTEAYYYVLGPAKETNIAVFWCLLTVAFSIKVFLTVTRLYFSAEEGGERSVCLAFAFLFLLLAMLVQAVREETLELGLEPGLDSMSQNLEPLLKMQGWDWALPVVKLAIRVGLAVAGSLLGAFLTFPGLRLAQTHHDALTMSEDRPMLQLRGGPAGFLLHTSFLSPLFVLWLWTKPMARDFLHQAPLGHTSFSLLSDSAFDSLRLWVLVVLCLLRLAVTRPHLQAYLCLAKARVEQLRREAGRIEAREIQRRVPTLAGREPGARGYPEREGPRLQPLLPAHQVVRQFHS
ncbi:TMEM161A [Cervus elaphus hippelaphus]|uniref:Transmembrane protein 161A n=1 Tax=Cervus elaphus hippelaphus TaxID=46360 RepID=A0A212D0M2_CEREH|nr:TMEM161A [Cervus elaphus hippelaphus]